MVQFNQVKELLTKLLTYYKVHRSIKNKNRTKKINNIHIQKRLIKRLNSSNGGDNYIFINKFIISTKKL